MNRNGSRIRRFDGYEVDLENKLLWVDQSLVDLPVKAIELLCVLIESEGKVVSKGELLNSVWQDAFVEEGVLPQNIYLLRKTFKRYGSDENLIQTVPRRGYRFTGDWSTPHSNGSITIERELIEQSYVTETELSEAEFGVIARDIRISNSEPAGRNVWGRHPFLYSAAIAAPIVTLLAAFAFYVGFPSRGDSASSYGSGELKYERITASGRAFLAGLSPDDQKVAYVVHTPENKYSLILHHMPTRSETVIIAPQELHLFNIRFSPDGNSIYYSAQNGDRRLSVYRIPIYGGSPQLITDDLAHCFSLSPDGEWLAMYRRNIGMETHDLDICRSRDCSDRRTIRSRGDGSGFIIWGASPSWSPDGKKLVATAFTKDPGVGRAKRHLIEIDVDSGAERGIASPDWHGVHQAYWTRDGKEIIVSVREKPIDPVQIWRLGYPSGNAQRITNDGNEYREFQIASDLSFIITATWSKSENLFLVPVDQPSPEKQLTFDIAASNGAWGLGWTPDGREIVYTKASGHQTGNLWRLNPETMEDVQITFDEAALPVVLDVTPDGKTVFFSSNRTGKPHIWQINLDGTNLRQITAGEAEGHPALSPDGKWLYYGGNGLWKMPLEGGPSVRLLDVTPAYPRVSPTDPSTFIARYYDLNEKEKQPYRIGLFREGDPTNPQVLNIPAKVYEWRPDGRGIYYADNGEAFGNIWFFSLDSGERTQMTNFTDQIISNISLSPDGSMFAVSRGSAIGNILKIKL